MPALDAAGAVSASDRFLIFLCCTAPGYFLTFTLGMTLDLVVPLFALPSDLPLERYLVVYHVSEFIIQYNITFWIFRKSWNWLQTEHLLRLAQEEAVNRLRTPAQLNRPFSSDTATGVPEQQENVPGISNHDSPYVLRCSIILGPILGLLTVISLELTLLDINSSLDTKLLLARYPVVYYVLLVSFCARIAFFVYRKWRDWLQDKHLLRLAQEEELNLLRALTQINRLDPQEDPSPVPNFDRRHIFLKSIVLGSIFGLSFTEAIGLTAMGINSLLEMMLLQQRDVYDTFGLVLYTCTTIWVFIVGCSWLQVKPHFLSAEEEELSLLRGLARLNGAPLQNTTPEIPDQQVLSNSDRCHILLSSIILGPQLSDSFLIGLVAVAIRLASLLEAMGYSPNHKLCVIIVFCVFTIFLVFFKWCSRLKAKNVRLAEEAKIQRLRNSINNNRPQPRLPSNQPIPLSSEPNIQASIRTVLPPPPPQNPAYNALHLLLEPSGARRGPLRPPLPPLVRQGGSQPLSPLAHPPVEVGAITPAELPVPSPGLFPGPFQRTPFSSRFPQQNRSPGTTTSRGDAPRDSEAVIVLPCNHLCERPWDGIGTLTCPVCGEVVWNFVSQARD